MMKTTWNIDVIIPALNEEKSIAKVIRDIPNWVRTVIVVDNGCTDNTATIAEDCGAVVVFEPKSGYGKACLKGISCLDQPDIVVFLDGDYSDRPQQMERLVLPIIEGKAQMVIGSRIRGNREKGALTPQAHFGNWLSCHLMHCFWGVRYTDLGPFRAISYSTLLSLGMKDEDYGWTVEMQIKAAIRKIQSLEVAVDYHKRIGISKISGTLRGVVGAGYKILSTIFLSALKESKQKTIKKRVILFSKYPIAGKSKTRMIPTLDAEGAANLQREMTTFIVNNLRKIEHKQKTAIEIRFSGGNSEKLKSWLGDDLLYRSQKGQDLGQKMSQAFLQSFHEGVEKCVIIGADCPGVTAEVLDTAFVHLQNYPMVIGPAVDGGYYLIGLTQHTASIFEGIEWGTENVLQQTLEKAANIPYKLLPFQNDIDRPEDIAVWKQIQQNSATACEEKISVIIPCLNEEDNIEKCLRSVVGKNIECIVVDGGSDDRTVALAQKFLNAKVYTTEKGRALQLNYGVRQATGNLFLFLHADCTLPVNFDQFIRETLSSQEIAAAAFEIELDSDKPRIKTMEKGINRRSHKISLPYGDQGIFVRRSNFLKVGGFREIDILEDYIFIMRLQKLGRIKTIPKKIISSARKWEKQGAWRTWLLNQIIVIGFHLGLPHKQLKRWYCGDQGEAS